MDLLISGLSEMPLYHDVDIATTFRSFLEYLNTKNPKVTHTTCVNNGGPACTFVMEWE
ncbi:hypothetical protein JW933_03395 [candidate division FCPU426 bacterium]|nr:hypothetical protein [candidate division FCPU426 bacterium]